MYGTVARMLVKPGHLQDLMKMQRSWDDDRAPRVDGAVATYVFKSDQDENEFTLVAIFRDRQAYEANAADPAQDAWYHEMRSHLSTDPEWRDGEIVMSSTY